MSEEYDETDRLREQIHSLERQLTESRAENARMGVQPSPNGNINDFQQYGFDDTQPLMKRAEAISDGLCRTMSGFKTGLSHKEQWASVLAGSVINDLIRENARMVNTIQKYETISPCACCGIKLAWIFAGDGTVCREALTGIEHKCAVDKERWDKHDFPEGTYRYAERRAINAETERDTLKSENGRLKAVVEKLPKTKDGVTITPGMETWSVLDPGTKAEYMRAPYVVPTIWKLEWECREGYLLDFSGDGSGWRGTFSTREAALGECKDAD
jgi:hypothetical protein